MSKGAQKVNIAGKPLVCHICQHDEFWKRETLMNTRGATFFNFDWLNKGATNYVCDRCGYVFWFIEK